MPNVRNYKVRYRIQNKKLRANQVFREKTMSECFFHPCGNEGKLTMLPQPCKYKVCETLLKSRPLEEWR